MADSCARRAQVVLAGKVVLVDGTSASAPLFAAMVSAIVAERKAAGMGANGDFDGYTACPRPFFGFTCPGGGGGSRPKPKGQGPCQGVILLTCPF